MLPNLEEADEVGREDCLNTVLKIPEI